jgi:hypothetical protein
MTLSELIASVPDTGIIQMNSTGMNRTVEGVDISETPDIAGYIAPNTLLLTTAMVYANDQTDLCELVRQLHSAGAAGVAIKLGRFISAVEPEVLETADSIGFPVCRIPPDMTLGIVSHKLQSYIWGIETKQLYYAIDIQKKISNTLFQDASPEQIIQYFSRLLKRNVIYFDYFFDPEAMGISSADNIRLNSEKAIEIGALLREIHRREPIIAVDEFLLPMGGDLPCAPERDMQRAQGGDLPCAPERDMQSSQGRDMQRAQGGDMPYTPGGDLRCIVAPIEPGSEYPRFLVILYTGHIPEPFSYFVAEQAGSVFSYLVHNSRHLQEGEWRLLEEHFFHLIKRGGSYAGMVFPEGALQGRSYTGIVFPEGAQQGSDSPNRDSGLPDNSSALHTDGSLPQHSDGRVQQRSDDSLPRRSDGSLPQHSDGRVQQRSDDSLPRRSDGGLSQRSDGGLMLLAPLLALINKGKYQAVAAGYLTDKLPRDLANRDHFSLVFSWLEKKTAYLGEDCALVPIRAQNQLLLLLRKPRAALQPLLQEMSDSLLLYLPLELRFGVGNQVNGPEGLSFTYIEASASLRKALEDPSLPAVKFYFSEGIDELLQFAPADHIRHFCVYVLGSLAYPESEYDASLRDTLEAFLGCQCDITQTSKELYIHRNTVKYRIEKIQSILPQPLSDPDFSLQLRLAIFLSQKYKKAVT